MRIKEVILLLERIQQEFGNVEVNIQSFDEEIGTIAVFQRNGYAVISDEEPI